MTQSFTILTSVVFLLSSCGQPESEEASCIHEESARNLVPTTSTPAWEAVITYVDGNSVGKTVDPDAGIEEDIGFRERIQVWDCLDMTWWSPAASRKVVQIWVDQTECTLYERSYVELYACDSHESEDDAYRDRDLDGFYETEGDCDDADELANPDTAEICDEVDNDCNGQIDDLLDCDDIEALD